MEYPGSKFTHFWRRVVFMFFIVTFTISTPVLILYTIGYRYDTKEGILKKTGALSIDALPHTATILVNEQNQTKKNPLQLSAVSKGNYQIRITQEGYYEWKKEAEVRDKQTTYIKDIQLIKRSIPELLIRGAITSSSLSPNGELLIYTLQTAKTATTFLYDLSKRKNIPLALDQKNFFVSWSPDQRFALLTSSEELPSTTIIIPLEHPTNSINLSTSTSKSFLKIAWRASGLSELYYETADHEFYSFNPQTQVATFLKNSVGVQDWIPHGDSILALALNTSTRHLELVNDFIITPKVIFSLEDPAFSSNSSGEWKIKKAQGEVIALGHDAEKKIILVHDKKITSIPADHILFSHAQNRWLLWNSYEVWSFEETNGANLLIRSGDTLRDVALLDEFDTLLLMWERKNTILFPYYYVSHEFQTFPLQNTLVDSEHRSLYFVSDIGKEQGLWTLTY